MTSSILYKKDLDQTSKESIIECAHNSGGLIGSCASSRENCECGLYFIIKEPNLEEEGYECAAYLVVVESSTVHLTYIGNLSSSRIWRVRAVAYVL